MFLLSLTFFCEMKIFIAINCSHEITDYLLNDLFLIKKCKSPQRFFKVFTEIFRKNNIGYGNKNGRIHELV